LTCPENRSKLRARIGKKGGRDVEEAIPTAEIVAKLREAYVLLRWGAKATAVPTRPTGCIPEEP
jgi:hypothetical protein